MAQKILIVEDNSDLSQLLAFYLSDAGYETSRATVGKLVVCRHVAFALSKERESGSSGAMIRIRQDRTLGVKNAKKRCGPERSLLQKWFKEAEFKILCAACWDEAKAVCGGFTNREKLP
jgi:hypothetical protein